MALTVVKITSFVQQLVHQQSFPVFVAYMSMVILARWWQKISSPLSLKAVLVVYNLLCSAISIYTLVGFINALMASPGLYDMEPSDALRPVYFLYWVTKNLELLDTLFMVVRHKQRQISFLHVFHHATMLLLSDLSYHRYPWPAIAVPLALNAFIHVVLYFYYGLSAWDATWTSSWKRRLTEMQITQFGIDFVFAAVGYLYHGFCIYGLLYGVMMTYLFSNFYYHAYIKTKTQSKKTQ